MLSAEFREHEIDRRAFISGGWLTSRDSHSTAIAVAIPTTTMIEVRTRPERMADAERAIAALDGVSVFARDPRGQFQVAVDATDSGRFAATLTAMSMLPGVIAATVAHAGKGEPAT